MPCLFICSIIQYKTAGVIFLPIHCINNGIHSNAPLIQIRSALRLRSAPSQSWLYFGKPASDVLERRKIPLPLQGQEHFSFGKTRRNGTIWKRIKDYFLSENTLCIIQAKLVSLCYLTRQGGDQVLNRTDTALIGTRAAFPVLRSMGFLLAAALIFNTLPASGLAVSASGREAGLCEHHQEHDADCGYIPKSEDAQVSSAIRQYPLPLSS